MKQLSCDIFIIGAGAAGMAAAVSARRKGASVIIAEQADKPGGVLNRCIHHGFGLAYFREDLTGTEYAERFRRQLAVSGAELFTRTAVLRISDDRTAVMSSPAGMIRVSFRACILASGSTERTYNSIPVAGTRPEGIYTAGCIQGLINEGGHDIGSRIVILGSGNVGQIMGRQLIQAGKTIAAMIEQNDEPGGLKKNHHECIEAYNIPLRLHSTIIKIHGTPRLSAVTVKDIINGDTEVIECDTLLTAMGLIPDRTLAVPLMKDGRLPGWMHLCGNCDHIHDIVDSVTVQGEQTILSAAASL